ncbi:MAG: class I SAM-dependent methyltransferase [Actinobacteria bacterium]|nr:class I SAM-dependent methyltransferase [Actinomycetota bacterium]
MKGFLYSGMSRDRWQLPDRVLGVVDVDEGEKIADLGAGAGYFTYRLARAVGREGTVYAVDTDPDMVEHIRDRADRKGYRQIQVVHADGDAPQLPEKVDVVLTVNAFHHLPDDRVGFFTKLIESISPGGRLAVIEARPRWFLFGHATEPEEIRRVLQRAGYVELETHGFLPRQSFTTARRPSRS